MVRLTELIGPAFYDLHHAIRSERFTHYWLKGGRGSLKSSTVSVELIRGIMDTPDAHGLCLRKVGNTLGSSVYEQCLWAIDMLGVSDLWQAMKSPLTLIYKPTGQKIHFRGADKPKKIKSIKVKRGYIRYLWYEEVDEFEGIGEIRVINQSVMRGGDKFDAFYTYNPPASVSNWVNVQTAQEALRRDTMVHTSCYLDAPKKWIGAQAIAEAEYLKQTNLEAYRHEYLGEITGTGGEVFDNVRLERITDGQIKEFCYLRHGVDFGYATDPFVYIGLHYDKKHRTLYLFDETYAIRLSNKAAYDAIHKRTGSDIVFADSAEPKTIDEFRSYGMHMEGAKKGRDSVRYGVQFLQNLEAIVIDPKRCPNAAREFTAYELDKDTHGNFIAQYPDRDNHTIDAVRYALNRDMLHVTVR